MGASAAERPSFLELEDLHGRDDNLFDILAAIANQQWLRQRCNLASGEVRTANVSQFDGQIQSKSSLC